MMTPNSLLQGGTRTCFENLAADTPAGNCLTPLRDPTFPQHRGPQAAPREAAVDLSDFCLAAFHLIFFVGSSFQTPRHFLFRLWLESPV